MQTVPYLTFAGDCEAAFRFYERILGGKAEIQTHGESPMAGEVPPAWHSLVLHAYLSTGGAVLMGSDSPPDRHEKPQGVSVSLHVESPAEAERIFAALAEGGTVTMPMAETFWSPRFGMLVDRFGIPWMVNCSPEA